MQYLELYDTELTELQNQVLKLEQELAFYMVRGLSEDHSQKKKRQLFFMMFQKAKPGNRVAETGNSINAE